MPRAHAARSPLPQGREFYERGAAAMARALLGCVLVRLGPRGRVSGVIVETEAYLGVRDRASHAYGGRRTARNESMYLGPGRAYVYFTYGMHHCVNVVCGQAGVPRAVLIRALRPLEGIGAMHEARARAGAVRLSERDLCRGPGRLCLALSIDRRLDGHDLTMGAPLWVEARSKREERGTLGEVGTPAVGGSVRRSARIGVGYAGAWARRPLRYSLEGHPCVSGRRAGPPEGLEGVSPQS